LTLSRQEGSREQWASRLGFHELECLGELDTAFCSPTPVHPFVDLPDFLWSLTLVLVKRSLFHVSNRGDVEEKTGSAALTTEGDTLGWFSTVIPPFLT